MQSSLHVDSMSCAQRSEPTRRCPHLVLQKDGGAGRPSPSGDHCCSLTDPRLWRPGLSLQVASCLTSEFVECIHFMAASASPSELAAGPRQPASGGAAAPNAPGWRVFAALGGVAGIAIGVCAFFFLPGPKGGAGESLRSPVAARDLSSDSTSEGLDRVRLSRSAQPTKAEADAEIQRPLKGAASVAAAAEPNDGRPASEAAQVPTSASVESAVALDDAGLVAPDSDAAPAVAFANGQAAGVDEYTHLVGDGETLWDIAAANGVDVEDLATRNGLSSDALVAAGDVLVIPAVTTGGGE